MAKTGKKKKPISKPQPQVETQKLRARIDVFDESIVASKFSVDGIERKFVSSGDVAEMFASEGGKKITWFADLTNVAACGASSNGDSIYIVTRPAGQTKIAFEIGKKKERIEVSMPALVAKMVCRKGKWKRLERVFAFRGKLTEMTKLFVPPLPNMHNDGSVCMGSVDIKTARGSASQAFDQVFIKSVFSDHLLDSPLNKSGIKKFRNIYAAIKKTGGKVNFKYLTQVGTYGKTITVKNG